MCIPNAKIRIFGTMEVLKLGHLAINNPKLPFRL